MTAVFLRHVVRAWNSAFYDCMMHDRQLEMIADHPSA